MKRSRGIKSAEQIYQGWLWRCSVMQNLTAMRQKQSEAAECLHMCIHWYIYVCMYIHAYVCECVFIDLPVRKRDEFACILYACYFHRFRYQDDNGDMSMPCPLSCSAWWRDSWTTWRKAQSLMPSAPRLGLAMAEAKFWSTQLTCWLNRFEQIEDKQSRRCCS